ncbi:murein biosynthesis integral membrane protein MurJ [Streptacidiphilus sp. N1-10]|uniref:Murein biosynthesis integral membrane protein MurJ n=1 Tax=Streptacidiphilus jeojiensis TaxID=3229225 RepID=A0ABV6Y0V9_9ACTN
MGSTRHAARHAARRRPAGGLARTSALMVVGTVVSRATGFIRLGLQVAALGTGLLATTYNNANTVPASLYTLLIGGALNSVLVPQLVRARVQHRDGGLAHEQRLLTMVLCVLAAGTLLAVLAAPEIASIYLPDTPDHHAAFELTVVFARFLLPQILFYGLYAILGQLLNARNRFGAMMWTPVLNNLVLITLFGLYLGLIGSSSGSTSVTPADVRLLGIGTTAGIALQALALIPYLRGCGFSFRPRFDWRGTGLRASISAARWTLLFVAANLAAVTVVTRYATAADSALPHGGVGTSAYTYAQTIWQLPQSVITVSLVTALLPRLSRAVAEQRLDDVRDELSRGLRATGMVIVPAAFFFLAFGPEITALLPGHGPTLPMGRMLQAFALGLIPFSAQYLLLRGFYAFSDTRTPFWAALWISGLDIALAVGCHLLLPARWAVTGMAAAYSLSYLAGLLLTATRLRRRLAGRLDGRRLSRTYLKLVLAAGPAAAASWAVVRSLHLGAPVSAPAGALAMGPLFLASAWLLRLPELRLVRRFAPGARVTSGSRP